MMRLALLLTLACAAAHADTEICQTVNGRTTCTHATGNLACVSVNGETRCTRLDGQSTQAPPTLPDIAAPGVDIRQENGRLRVRAGGIGIEVPGY